MFSTRAAFCLALLSSIVLSACGSSQKPETLDSGTVETGCAANACSVACPCPANAQCLSGSCSPCGAKGEACCTGTAALCASSTNVCLVGFCQPCGGSGQACCGGTTSCSSAVQSCQSGFCQPCGALAQTCCQGAAPCATASNVCVNSLCVSPCGDAVCTAAETCNSCPGDCGACPMAVLTVIAAGSDATGEVISSPAGIDCNTDGVPTCSASFQESTEITLTATPTNSAFARFLGWSLSGCAGDAGPCTFPLNAAQSVTATFGCEAGKICPF